MTYTQTINYIHGLDKFSKHLGLDRMKLFLDKLGNPQKKLQIIHVAGTNGKGSTTTMIASVLMEQGLKVGKYTSPFILDFRERMMINNEMIGEDELSHLTEQLSEIAKDVEKELESPREFEFITAMAFCYFAQENCDVVVLEVGLGGRFDPTNSIETSMVSVITPIGLDHTQYLGDTVAEIAFEKSGIMKKRNVVVVNPYQQTEAMQVICGACWEKECELNIPQPSQLVVEKMDSTGSSFTYHGYPFSITMVGNYQIGNAITAIDAVLALKKYGIDLSLEKIATGLKKAYIPARMEILKVGTKTVILDGAHNPHGMTALAESLSQLGMTDVIGVMGMLQDKNCQSSLDIITPYLSSMITTMPDSPRSLDSGILEQMARDCNGCAQIVPYPDYKEALKAALSAKENIVVVMGSLYLVSDIRRTILEEYNEKN